MPVKHWSFAGLLLTYWCNAQCQSCYLRCGPERREWLTVEQALEFWLGLIRACPHGCRVHLTGGEPFGDWDRLIKLAREGKRAGLGPLDKVETNAFWACNPDEARDRLKALDDAGMQTLAISADPYHQQFVQIERVRMLAQTAEDVLGAARVQVRWRDWLEHGFDTAELSAEQRDGLFVEHAPKRVRLNGRAAERLAPLLAGRPVSAFADSPCRESLLRSRHVHVGPDGLVFPGVCVGIVLGRLGQSAAGDVWRRLVDERESRPVVAALGREGPCGLLPEATAAGFAPAERYASKCHLCWQVRRFFATRNLHADELGPEWLYEMTEK